MINHKSYRTFKDIALSRSQSVSAGIDAANKQAEAEKKKAVAARARNKAYWQNFKNRERETKEAAR